MVARESFRRWHLLLALILVAAFFVTYASHNVDGRLPGRPGSPEHPSPSHHPKKPHHGKPHHGKPPKKGKHAKPPKHGKPPKDGKKLEDLCKQSPAIVPKSKYVHSSQFTTNTYRELSAKFLQGAIQVPTVSYDDMSLNVTEEPRFEVFLDLHKYLFETFPLAAKHAEKVNTYGLLFTFQGKDESLKPALLMAHQDVVPVNPDSLGDWTYPPFAGHYDGEFIWGRGASDTKQSLVAQLEAVESLLAQGWVPERTLLLSFGFDEEITGVRGAKKIAGVIHERYGTNGIEVLIDEGFGILEEKGALFAAPAVAEKGRSDYTFTLHVKGGHASIPPDHSGIGIMSELVVDLENNPWNSHILPGSVAEKHCDCLAAHSPDLSKEERFVFGHSTNNELLIHELDKVPVLRYGLRTSQAITIFQGGVKINALPETIVMEIDHRIAPESSVEEVDEHIVSMTRDICEEYDLNLEFEGKPVHTVENAAGYITIERSGSIEPAPISPFEGEVWDLIAGTSKHVFEDVFNATSNLVVAPQLMTANTDTAHFWELTHNIYRFNPAWIVDMIQYHTVDERLGFRSHLTSVAWFYEFIINTCK